jgi:signal transduction histidine kinase
MLTNFVHRNPLSGKYIYLTQFSQTVLIFQAILHSSEEIRDLVKNMDDSKGDFAKSLLDATDTILLCVAHQSSLVDEILQFSKLDAAMLTLTPSIAQPKYDLAETLKLFQPELRAKNISFEYAMDLSFDENKVGYVLADLKRIKQVLVRVPFEVRLLMANDVAG